MCSGGLPYSRPVVLPVLRSSLPADPAAGLVVAAAVNHTAGYLLGRSLSPEEVGTGGSEGARRYRMEPAVAAGRLEMGRRAVAGGLQDRRTVVAVMAKDGRRLGYTVRMAERGYMAAAGRSSGHMEAAPVVGSGHMVDAAAESGHTGVVAVGFAHMEVVAVADSDHTENAVGAEDSDHMGVVDAEDSDHTVTAAAGFDHMAVAVAGSENKEAEASGQESVRTGIVAAAVGCM